MVGKLKKAGMLIASRDVAGVADIFRTKWHFLIRPWDNAFINARVALWHLYARMERQFYKVLVAPPQQGVREHSNIIWWLWLQGESKAPAVCALSLSSIRHFYPDKKLVILTEANIGEYVDLPSYIMDKYRKGIITKTHFSDLLRLELLIRYGGMWVDATVLCTNRASSEVLDAPFFMFHMDRWWGRDNYSIGASWLVVAYSNSPTLIRLRRLLYAYWQRYNYMADYYLIDIFMALVLSVYREEDKSSPYYSFIPSHMLRYHLNRPYTKERWEAIIRSCDFHKLTYKEEHVAMAQGKPSFYGYLMGEYYKWLTSTVDDKGSTGNASSPMGQFTVRYPLP